MKENKTIAIAGATGFVGSELTLKLLDMGYSVRALARTPSKWPVEHEKLTVIQGDIHDTDAVNLLIKDCHVLYYLVHSLSASEDNFEFEEASAAVKTLKVLNRSHLNHVIYLGGLGPEGDLSRHLRSRHLVGEILGAGKVACTEFRASIVLGANSTSFEMIKALCHRLPFRPDVSWLNTPSQPLAQEDLIEYLISSLALTSKGHQVVEIGGPNVLSYGDLLDLYFSLMKVSRPKILLPSFDQKYLLSVIDKIIPEYADVGKKLFLSLEYPTVVTNNKASDLFPEIKPIPAVRAMKMADEASSTHYSPLWQSDFWKELIGQQMTNSKITPQVFLDSVKKLTNWKSGSENKS